MSSDGPVRTGPGRPFGSKDSPDSLRQRLKIKKIEARARLAERVIDQMEPMLDAQFHNAKGIKHFFLRDQSGKFVMIDDPKRIETALNCGDEGSYYWIFTKDPSVQAFSDLMNRAIDKPTEHHELTGDDGGPIQIEDILTRARKRLAQHRGESTDE